MDEKSLELDISHACDRGRLHFRNKRWVTSIAVSTVPHPVQRHGRHEEVRREKTFPVSRKSDDLNFRAIVCLRYDC